MPPDREYALLAVPRDYHSGSPAGQQVDVGLESRGIPAGFLPLPRKTLVPGMCVCNRERKSTENYYSNFIIILCYATYRQHTSTQTQTAKIQLTYKNVNTNLKAPNCEH